MDKLVKIYLQGNEDAQAYPGEGLYQLADYAGYARDSEEWNAHVDGGAAYRFNGYTFKTTSEKD